MESARVCRRDSWIFFRRRTQMFSVFRKRRCRKDSLPLRRRAIISIGITPSGKAIQGDRKSVV